MDMVFDLEKIQEIMGYRDWETYIKKRLYKDELNIGDILRDNKIKLSIRCIDSNRGKVFELIDNAENVYETLFVQPEDLESFLSI